MDEADNSTEEYHVTPLERELVGLLCERVPMREVILGIMEAANTEWRQRRFKIWLLSHPTANDTQIVVGLDDACNEDLTDEQLKTVPLFPPMGNDPLP